MPSPMHSCQKEKKIPRSPESSFRGLAPARVGLVTCVPDLDFAFAAWLRPHPPQPPLTLVPSPGPLVSPSLVPRPSSLHRPSRRSRPTKAIQLSKRCGPSGHYSDLRSAIKRYLTSVPPLASSEHSTTAALSLPTMRCRLPPPAAQVQLAWHPDMAICPAYTD